MKRLIALLILKEIPVISKLVAWITDPKMVARKRTIVTFLGMIAAGLISAKGLISFVCDGVSSGVSGFLCSVNVDLVAQFIGAFVEIINRPEISGIGFLTSLWALVSAYKKNATKALAEKVAKEEKQNG